MKLISLSSSILLPLVIAYLLMIIAQTCGPQIIIFLHGSEANLETTITTSTTTTSNNDLSPPPSSSNGRLSFVRNILKRRRRKQLPQLTLCEEYEAAHYDKISDILHVSGMIGVLFLMWLLLVIPYLHLRSIKQTNNTKSSASKVSSRAA